MPHWVVVLISVPLFTGAIGYITNWSGIWMLFYPVRFMGVTIPGLAPMAGLLPRRIQQIPGIMHGGLGWQGIIPSRAAKMGSISVDKGIAKLGSPGEFYDQLEPDKIAEHILATAQGDMRELVETILMRDHPQLWAVTPQRVKEAVHARVQQQLPQIVHEVTDEIGSNIDQLFDLKLMVIKRMEEEPELCNRVFLEVGRKELKFVINMGFWIGLTLGFPVAVVSLVFPHCWVLPILGVVVGYVTNWIALWLIFEPVEPRQIGRFRVHGLFLRRQQDVADVYAKIIADDVITLSNLGHELLQGPSNDRTRRMIEDALRPATDLAVGRARLAVKAAVGANEYAQIRDTVAHEAVEYTMTPLDDPQFNREQSERVHKLIAERMRELPPADFGEMLRSAMREDEWLLLLHGAVLGFGAGCVHLAIFGV